MAISAQELGQTMDCRVPNCDQTATASRGIYAGLCDYHARLKRERIARGQDGGHVQTAARRPQLTSVAPAQPARAGASPASFRARLRDLGKLAQRVDAARERARKAEEKAKQAKAAADQLEREFCRQMRDLGGGET